MGHHAVFLPFGTEMGPRALALLPSHKGARHGVCVCRTRWTSGFVHFFKQYHFFALKTFQSLSSSISEIYIFHYHYLLSSTEQPRPQLFYVNGTYLILVDTVFGF